MTKREMEQKLLLSTIEILLRNSENIQEVSVTGSDEKGIAKLIVKIKDYKLRRGSQ